MGIKTRSFVFAAAAVLLPATLAAQGRVGVTSQTDGDPLGKPPTAAERILRVGIDIQANEVVTTKADDRAHLVFLDGTALTVSPNAQLVIDKFVYDPNTKTGELAISATTGVFRLVGGKISKSSAISLNTPSATIVLTRALAALEAQGTSGKTTAPDDKAKQSGFSARNSGQNFTPNQNALTQATQANSAAQAVSTVNQQRDPLTAQVTTTAVTPPMTTATASAPPTPPTTSGPTWCPPPTDYAQGRHPAFPGICTADGKS